MDQRPRRSSSSRVLLAASAGLFILSSLFPIAASLLRERRVPRWLGVADVGVAAILIVLALAIVARKPNRFAESVVAAGFRAYRGLANVLLVLLVLFFLVGDRVDWNILLPGLAWRAWLLVLALPSWLSMWKAEA